MSKYYGNIGFAVSSEISPGVWDDTIVERAYSGDVIRNYNSRWSSADDNNSINDDVSVSNQISILSDPFAINNFSQMKYITFMGSKWKITDIEVQYPRLILTVGGVYNA